MRGVKISLRYIDPGVKISYDILTPGSIYKGVKISSHTGTVLQSIKMDVYCDHWHAINFIWLCKSAVANHVITGCSQWYTEVWKKWLTFVQSFSKAIFTENCIYHFPLKDPFDNDPLLYPPNNEVVGGYIGFTPSVRSSVHPSVRLSVRPSVRPSRMPCPLCNIYSSGWIISILATNDHCHKRVCCTQWPLTLTYIFKVIQPWLRKSCPLRSVYSFGWILFIFGTNDHYH